MAARFMKLHTQILGPTFEGECEVRQLSDFTASDESRRESMRSGRGRF